MQWQHFLHIFTYRGSILYSGHLYKVTYIQRLFIYRGYLYAEAASYAVGIYTEAAFHTGNIYKTVIPLMQKPGNWCALLLSGFFIKMWVNRKNENVSQCSNYCIKLALQSFPNEDKFPVSFLYLLFCITFLLYWHTFILPRFTFFLHYANCKVISWTL